MISVCRYYLALIVFVKIAEHMEGIGGVIRSYPIEVEAVPDVLYGYVLERFIFKNVVGSPYYNANLDLNEWYLHKEIVGENLWEMPWFYNNEYTTPVPRTVLRLANMISQSGYFSNCFLSSEMNNKQIVNRQCVLKNIVNFLLTLNYFPRTITI